MLKAYLTCMKEVGKLPRKTKFDKKFGGLFKEKYEAFGYNLYLEENLSKDSSKGKQKLFKKYGEISKEYLRKIYSTILVLLNPKKMN